MKKIYLLFFLYIHTVCFSFAITEKYESAFSAAQAFKKPMLLLFVGSDWSDESRKLLTLLRDQSAQDVIKNDIILCEIDFPEINRQNTQALHDNKMLKEKFSITQLPSVVLLDEKQEYVTTIGFVPVPPDVFARHIKETYLTYYTLRNALPSLKEKDVAALEQLLADAKSLQNDKFINLILHEGMKREKNGVFALEKYAHLVATGKAQSNEAVALRNTIMGKKEGLSIDARLQSAMLSFEAAKKEGNIEEALRPLEQVLKEVPSDHSQLWRIHFMVAKYLHEAHLHEKAAEYAQDAKKSAPEMFHTQLDAIISEK